MENLTLICTPGVQAWILAGGAHHTCYSQNLTAEHLQDFAEIAAMECVIIGRKRSFINSRMNCVEMIRIINNFHS